MSMTTNKTAAPSPRCHPRSDVAALPFRWRKAGRSREGEMFRRVCRDLRRHLGGTPSAVEEMMIQRAAWLQVHLARIDDRALADGGLTDHGRREYLAWSNSFCRTVALLGLRAPTHEPSVAELLAAATAPRPIARHDDGGDA